MVSSTFGDSLKPQKRYMERIMALKYSKVISQFLSAGKNPSIPNNHHQETCKIIVEIAE